jgi:hypothetical protein
MDFRRLLPEIRWQSRLSPGTLYRSDRNFRFALPPPLSYPDTVGSSVLSTPTAPDPKNKYTEE